MDRIGELFQKYYLKTASEAERTELAELTIVAAKPTLSTLIDAAAEWNVPGEMILEKEKTEEIADFILGYKAEMPHTPKVHFLRRWSWAAAVILALGAATLTIVRQPVNDKKIAVVKKNDIPPGSNKALLTLADGTIINLDSAVNGTIARQGSSSVTKLANGEIRYNLEGASQETKMMNTMSTPRGGQYKLTLPDGTHIWLNAESSVTYPAAFVGNNRKVKVTGEVYLEVVTDKSRPFIVDVDGKSSIEVLGTGFNIDAYADEGAIKTTLIEGSVRVANNAAKGVILKPGQQAVTADGGITIAPQVNTEHVLAWKNGIFNLGGSDIRQIMHQVERWYDVEVKYNGTLPAMKINGEIDRGVKLSGFMRFLTDYGLSVKLEGRTLTVSGRN